MIPDPLTPPDCDLSSFPYMELDVRRLRDSKFATTPNSDAFRAGILLWCVAWHQVPAASLPDDDVELSTLAGYGRLPVAVREWKKVREEALYGFVKCSDGRLYHPLIAEKAMAAMASREKFSYGRFCDRLRKENKGRTNSGKEAFGIPSFDQWKSGAYPHGIPPEAGSNSGGNPKESALKGEGEREGEGNKRSSVPNGTAGEAGSPAPEKSAEQMTKDELWAAGKSLLMQAGMPAKQCGSFVGKLVKDYGDAIVVKAVRTAVVARPADPAEYLKALCMHAAKERVSSNAQQRDDWNADLRAELGLDTKPRDMGVIDATGQS